MSGWDDTATIKVGDRRMRVNRRRARGPFRVWMVLVAVVVLAAAGIGAYLWSKRPTGLAAVPGNAVTAAGAFQAKIGTGPTITVALEIRNTAPDRVTVTAARIVAPNGLTLVTVAVLPPGDQYHNLALDGELPAGGPVTLGTNGLDQNAIIAARFAVICASLPKPGSVSGERIFVTVRSGATEREEELTPPVVNAVPWLLATAHSACGLASTGSAGPSQLPALPGNG